MTENTEDYRTLKISEVFEQGNIKKVFKSDVCLHNIYYAQDGAWFF